MVILTHGDQKQLESPESVMLQLIDALLQHPTVWPTEHKRETLLNSSRVWVPRTT
jgi:hypothetical protein